MNENNNIEMSQKKIAKQSKIKFTKKTKQITNTINEFLIE